MPISRFILFPPSVVYAFVMHESASATHAGGGTTNHYFIGTFARWLEPEHGAVGKDGG